MNPFDDDESMKADEVIAGRAAPGDESLAAVLGRLRAMAEEPAPPPSPALAAVLRDGLPAVALDLPAVPVGSPSRLLRGLRWAAGLGVAGKILLGAGVAVAAVAGTATLPVVPSAVQVPVRTVLTDLDHLIPGSAGGSVPAPTVTTPEPVDGAVSSEDHPPAEPDPGSGVDRSAPEDVAPSAEPPSVGRSLQPDGSGERSRAVEPGSPAGVAGDQADKPSDIPSVRPSAPSAGAVARPQPTVADQPSAVATRAADRSDATSPEAGQNQD